jgi:hypothetical protein
VVAALKDFVIIASYFATLCQTSKGYQMNQFSKKLAGQADG